MDEPEIHHIGNFRIVEKLGEGGMGIVYKAFDEKLQRTVAVKVLPASFADSEERKRRFLREARSAAAVTHANIATLYEVGEHEGRVFLVMEHVDGKTLHRILKEGALTIAEAMRISKGIVRGLARAHERGIVHRDMKPENVMLDAEGEVKILDFGLAKLREQTDEAVPSKSILEKDETEAQATQEGRVLGTPGYMSPEQAKGKSVDHRTDLFSFGVVLYEMLTRQRAFKGETSLDVMIALSRDQPVPPSRINEAVTPEIQRMVDRCLAKAPAERYANARELLTAIEAIASSTASGPGAITTSSPNGSSTGRSRGPLFLGVGVVAALALGAGVFALRGDAAKSPARPPPLASIAPTPAAVPTAITDLPPPKTSVPAAASEYAAGMQAYRDGTIAMGNAHVQRAAELDPSFAAAQVMLAAAGVSLLEDMRKHIAIASDHRADLSPRDVALLEVLQADAARDTPDFEGAWQRWSKLVDRFPGDATIAVLAAMHGTDTAHETEAYALLDRATSLDPKFTWPLMIRAIALNNEGRLDEALATVDKCLSITPTAASCLRRRAEVEARRGQCTKLLDDARAMVAIEPSGNSAYEWLATSLISTDAPIESIDQAVRKSHELQFEPTFKMFFDQLTPMTRPWLQGDFVGMEKLFPQWNKLIDDASSDVVVGGLLGMEAFVYEQSGQSDRALAIFDGYFKRMPGLVQDDPYGARPDGLWARRRAKRLSDAEFAAKREAAVATAMTKQSPTDTGSVWFAYYAAPTRTADEAREALDVLPRFSKMVPYDGFVFNDAAMGHVLHLVGRDAEAEPHLRRASDACYGLFDVYWHLRASSELGEILEAKHDLPGACTAYEEVIEHWGHAKPRSLLADETRVRAAKLGCKAAP